jgi:hypothetical protein
MYPGVEVADGRPSGRRKEGPPPGTKGLARKGEVLRCTRSWDHPRGPIHMSIRSAETDELIAIVHDGRRVEPADIRRERMELTDRETKRLEALEASTSYWKQPKHYWRDREVNNGSS